MWLRLAHARLWISRNESAILAECAQQVAVVVVEFLTLHVGRVVITRPHVFNHRGVSIRHVVRNVETLGHVIRRHVPGHIIGELRHAARGLGFHLGCVLSHLGTNRIAKEETDDLSYEVMEAPRDRVKNVFEVKHGLPTEREVARRRFGLLRVFE